MTTTIEIKTPQMNISTHEVAPDGVVADEVLSRIRLFPRPHKGQSRCLKHLI